MSVFEGSFREELIERYGAVEQSDGSYVDEFAATSWYNEEGSLHREDGPACIYDDGSVNWCLNGLTYPSFNAWCNKLNKTDEEKMMLRLRYA
jgi:hypothetical protein|tara:strand:+ start:197 stop:472 length:276 start_codon:yes stop_codon:yes gene_type:complete